ncbi:MAG: EAL domain-containing protein [Betaproteobacteria bacterium]|nr:EAL domain-containing protein [Betaproteobacteria bacterium]
MTTIPRTAHRPAMAMAFDPVREVARRLWSCGLCKSVAFSVFLLILGIESIILIPSAYNFQRNALQLLEQRAMTVMQSVVLAEEALAQPRELEQLLRKVQRNNPILALSVRRSDGATLGGTGDTDFSDFAIDEVLRGRRDKVDRLTLGGTCYDLAWSAAVSGERLVFLARMDSSHVNSELLAFVLRIAGLVALIVAVVTTGTMVVLYRSVLSPILRLRRSILGAAANPDHADDYRIRERPQDELGEVFQAHDEMLTRLAESKRADRLRAEERAHFLARHDPLTGLPNRDFFLEHLRQALSAACQREENVQVLVLNLAGFSAINDALGQDVGDRVLIEVARKLNQGISAGQFAARLGGDEFGIASTGSVSPAQVAEHAERILAEIELPLVIEGNEIRPRGRIGIASPSTGCVEGETVLHDAELVLSRIRSDARARYQFFSPEMTREAQKRQEIERELRQALKRGELQLFYQPKVALTQGGAEKAFSACEALIRWNHPRHGWISPGQFIPVAEACGLIAPVGEWVLREACAQIRRWLDAGLAPPRVAVNVSAPQFRDPRLPELVRGAMADAGVDADLLELEITETAAMEDVALTVAVLSTLKRLGVHLSIDDFGTGYSSLSYLRQLEIDSIKIDKSFVDDIGRDSNADAICDAIIQLGHSLGKRVVAEGVETHAQAEFLRLRRCEEAQGFLFARPMPAAEFADRLRRYA